MRNFYCMTINNTSSLSTQTRIYKSTCLLETVYQWKLKDQKWRLEFSKNSIASYLKWSYFFFLSTKWLLIMNIIHHTWNESFLFDYSANPSLFIFYLFKIWFWCILNWKKAWIERVAEQGDNMKLVWRILKISVANHLLGM